MIRSYAVGAAMGLALGGAVIAFAQWLATVWNPFA
jgi:hypothetical protein